MTFIWQLAVTKYMRSNEFVPSTPIIESCSGFQSVVELVV